MKRELSRWVVCPVTGDNLSLHVVKESDGEIMEGDFVSSQGRHYPIREGIPRMVSSETLEEGQKKTQEAFSEKWRRSEGFGYEEKSRDFYVNWYLERYKFGTLEALGKFLSKKQRVLDAGTGLGRDSLLYSRLCKGKVFGVDISQSIDSTYQRLKDHSNLHLLQADLTHLPFPPAFFDFIACDQVLHHTRDTEESFHRLVNHLVPGGDISIYVYRKKAPLREFSDDYLRALVCNMTENEVWRLSEQLTQLGKALSELKATVAVPEIPELGVKAGNYDLQRFVYWHMLKCYWNTSLRYKDSVMTNFDWYRPRYAHRHTAEEVKKWFSDAGIKIVTFVENESGISVRGQKEVLRRTHA